MTMSAVHHVTIAVRDMQRSLAFYRDALGLRVLADLPMGDTMRSLLKLDAGIGSQARAVLLTQGDSPVGQLELMEFSPAVTDAQPRRPGELGAFQISFEIRDEELAAILERLRAHDVRLFHPQPVGFELKNIGQANAILLKDPDGVLVALIRFPTRRPRAQHPETAVST